MTPQTTSRLMRRTFLEIASTKPIESIAPANAAAISTADVDTSPRLSSATMVTDTVSFAPDEMPRTKGPAMGL